SIASAEVAHAIAEHPALAERQRAIAESRAKLNDLVAGGPSEGEEPEHWRTTIQEAASARDRLEWDGRAELAKGGSFTEDVDAAALGRALAPDALAVAYLRYGKQPLIVPPARASPPVDSLLAFIVHPGGRVERVELGSCAEIEPLVQHWRDALRSAERTRGIA